MPKHVKPDRHSKDLLARDEVAAVHSHRKIYINDVPSPYLTKRQAAESVDTTRRRRRVISTVFVFILLACMAAGFGWFAWDTLKPEVHADVPQFNTAPIERKEFVDSVDVTTIVRPIDERSVVSDISGTVVEMMVEEGMFTEEGQELYRLDNPTVTETYNNAQQALTTAEEDVTKKTEALEEAQRALQSEQRRTTTGNSTGNNGTNRTNNSSNDNTSTTTGTTSTTGTQGQTTNIARQTGKPHFVRAMALTATYDNSDDATYGTDATGTNTNGNSNSSSSSSTTSTRATTPEGRVQAAQKDLDDANDRLKAVQDTFDRAQEQLDRLTVRAPIAGTVHDISGSYGLNTYIVGSERLCTVSDYSAYIMREQIPPERIDQVYEGLEARLSFPSIPDLFLTANVTSTEDREDGMRIASVVLENADERIVTDMACNVSIVVQSIPDALVVPLEAVRINEDGSNELCVLLDPTRGISANVRVNVIATNALEAAVEAGNIQEGTSVVV